ncbi:hypothetical protein MASR2M15_25290 [Anaerolineales bacterium]
MLVIEEQEMTFTISVRKLTGRTPVEVNFPVPDGFNIQSAGSNRGAVAVNGQMLSYTDDVHVGDVGKD